MTLKKVPNKSLSVSYSKRGVSRKTRHEHATTTSGLMFSHPEPSRLAQMVVENATGWREHGIEPQIFPFCNIFFFPFTLTL